MTMEMNPMRILTLITGRRVAAGLMTWLMVCLLSTGGCGIPGTAPLPAPVTQSRDTASTGPTPTLADAAMPDVVGKRLVDASQLLSAAGYPKISTVDASGRHRPILEPVNWVVQAQDPRAGQLARPGTAVTLHVVKPTDGKGSARSVNGVMPNVVCKDLQSAQDVLQAAGFFNISSADSTGKGRPQLIDRNWIVVTQSVASGERPDRWIRITLGTVKFSETGAAECSS